MQRYFLVYSCFAINLFHWDFKHSFGSPQVTVIQHSFKFILVLFQPNILHYEVVILLSYRVG